MAFTPVASGDVIQSGAINSIVSGASFYSTDTGTDGVTYKVPFNSTATNKNTIPAFTDGLIISFRAAIANVGASTLQILTTGGTPLGGLSKAITKFGGLPLVKGDIQANQLMTVVFNANQDRFELLNPALRSPGARLDLTATVAVANTGVLVLLNQYAATYDTNSFASTANRLTVPTGLGGKYLVELRVGFPSDPTGARVAYIRKNGSTIIDSASINALAGGLAGFLSFTSIAQLNAGDYLEALALQNSSTNPLNVSTSHFSIAYLGA